MPMTHSGSQADEGPRLRGRGRLPLEAQVENGEIVSDSAEGYRHKGYAITMAQKLNPGAELLIDHRPVRT